MLFFNIKKLFFPDCGKNPFFCFCFICFLHLLCKQMYYLVIWHFFVSKSHLNYKRNISSQNLLYFKNWGFFFFFFFFAKCQWHFVFSHVVRYGYAYPLLKFILWYWQYCFAHIVRYIKQCFGYAASYL